MSRYEADLTILQENTHSIYDQLKNTNVALSLPIPNDMHVNAIRATLPKIMEKLKESLETSGYTELED